MGGRRLLMVAAVAAPALVFANPTHPVVTQGSATVTTTGSQTTIHTGNNTVINWSSFNIGANQTTVFIEPTSTSVVWNHITDPNPTQILGHLDANGYIILQNQSGFYVGGNAVINAAGLIMTTAPTVPLNVFGGGSWDFSAPPPTASIINYGEINAGPNGSVFLISRDIQNNGTITAPGGKIGLYAGEDVLISSRADGRGFSAQVTLPEGSVDNTGKLIADAGTIALNAQVVNQGGFIQANSVQQKDGVIEIVASQAVNLTDGSTISAQGDSQGTSSGGQVTIKSGGTFSDTANSSISVAGGAQGGNGGKVEVSASQLGAINSQIDGRAEAGWTDGRLTIDPVNITLSTSGSTATSGTVTEGSSPSTLTLNPNSLDSFSQILLQASGNITLASTWTLPDSASATTLTLQAGNNITFNSGDRLNLGQNWSLNLIAGANFNTPTGVTAGTGNITMSGSAGVQSENGGINLIAGNGISIGTGSLSSSAGGNILMQAMGGNITLGGFSGWNLSDSTTPASLTMQAAGNVTMSGGITAGQDWSLDVVAGATFASQNAVNASGTGSVTLSGSGTLQSQNGAINVVAANSVTVGTGAIATFNGGNVSVDAVTGSVNAGQNQNGYTFLLGGVSSLLGGISTAAGGNVNITAGGNVTSYLPTGSSTSPTDAGSGAFGTQPGVVTVTAGGSVYGHYVAANSTENGVVVPSTITALTGSAGSSTSISSLLALSLATGSWVVNAPNGSINLQEVRNPNGALNASGIGSAASQNNIFNYSPYASVTLDAGSAVNLVGADVPRDSSALVPIIYPPTLTIDAGAGGISLGNSLTLFPSAHGNLTVNTTVPAGTVAAAGSPPPGSFEGNGFTLAMSDSSATRWVQGQTDFANNHGATPIQIHNSQPVVFNIAGDLDDVTIISPKETQVTVGGSMNNLSFSGQNLHSGDVTFFHVAGQIFDQNTYALVTLSTSLYAPPPLYPGALTSVLQLLQNAVVPGSGPSSPNGGQLFPSLSLFYLPNTHQLGYDGIMSSAVEALLLGTLKEKTYTAGGQPILNASGDYVTTTATFANSPALISAIQALYAQSQNSVSLANAAQGIVIGGPGALSITAQSMNLGVAAQGISSVGPAVNNALAKIASTGASINIKLAGDLDMFASEISSWYGGAINIDVGGVINAGLANLPIQSPYVPHGIWTSGDSDVTVIADGNINIAGSRIATFDGGNVFVESLTGNVNAGNGNLQEILVNEVNVNGTTVTTPQQPIAGSGILATTLPDSPSSLAPGNITVLTPRGNIEASVGGITQQPENGNTSLAPTVTLSAGTFGPDGQVLYNGNIDAGDSGVISINTVAKATGKVNGLFISTGNSVIYGNTIDVTDVAGGTVGLVTSGGSISGTIIAVGNVNVAGGAFTGVALAQNVSGGGAQSALPATATATASSQTASAQAGNTQKAEANAAPIATNPGDDQNRGGPLLAKYVGRVTVILPGKP